MNFKFVETMTKQNIKLFGCLSKNNNKKCILYIPGLTGNFFESKFPREIAEESIKRGYDFLFSHNQGSFQIIDFPFLREDGKLKSKTRGATYEKFEDCVFDIDGWIEFLEKLDYEEIVVLCHSMGCNKIVYYLNQNNSDKISKVILLAPQDNVNFSKLEMHEGLLDEAKENIKNGNPEKILSKKILGFCLMSSETYYQEITNKNINNIPYKTPNGDFSLVQAIDKPIYVLIGSEDIGEHGKEYMEKVIANCQNAKYDIIADANHNFKNKEAELIEFIFNYLNN